MSFGRLTDIVIDYGKCWVIDIEDCYSRYGLASYLTMTATAWDCILALESAKSEALRICGSLPDKTTDNGPQLLASKFEKHLRANGFVHIHIAREHPQSIGRVERFHRTVKKRYG